MRRLLLIALCAALLAPAARPASAADSGASAPKKGSEITLNLKDADLRQVAQMVSAITGKNFIVDPRAQGRVTVISAKPISSAAVFSVFQSVLEVHGLAAMPSGNNTWKIVPAVEGRQQPGVNPKLLGKAPGDAMITEVIQLQNVQVQQLVGALRPLMSSYAQLAAYPPSNMLILSDRAGNVQRMIKLAEQLDQPLGENFDLVQLKYASAVNVSQVLTSMLQGSSGNGQIPLKLAADPRTNSILVSGSPAERLQVKALLAQLDQPSEGGGNTHVIYLHYAHAEDLAKILEGYGKAKEQAASAAAGGKTAGGGGAADQKISVIADKDINALIVTASGKDLADIRNIIKRLDVRRAQVLVQGIIAELTSSAASQLGISWAADSAAAAGLTNFPNGVVDVGSLVAQANSGGGSSSGTSTGSFNSSSVPGGLLFGVGRIVANGTSFVALLNALASDAKTNILATPSLVTLDNQKASLISGQKVPMVTGQYTNTGQGSTSSQNLINPFQTVQQEQVGLEIDIQPQINYGGDTVTLTIDAKNSSIAPTVQGAAGIVTNNREVKTSVIAKNKQILVLGGLINTQLQQSQQKVPLLGDIPLLGNLFRYRKAQKDRDNLMVFLRPVILRNASDVGSVTKPRYDQIRELEMGRGTKVSLLPGVKPPVLPTFAPSDETMPPAEEGTILQPAPASTGNSPAAAAATSGNGDRG